MSKYDFNPDLEMELDVPFSQLNKKGRRKKKRLFGGF